MRLRQNVFTTCQNMSESTKQNKKTKLSFGLKKNFILYLRVFADDQNWKSIVKVWKYLNSKTEKSMNYADYPSKFFIKRFRYE